MSKIQYIKGDATSPQSSGNRIIVHCCNDLGKWGKGFVLAISRKWKQPEKAYREWFRNEKESFKLGAVQYVSVAGNITENNCLMIANLIGQEGIYRKGNIPPIRYEAIRIGFEKICRKAKEIDATIHMPRLGCGLAGGDWSIIESIIKDEFSSKDIAVTVYDFNPQKS